MAKRRSKDTEALWSAVAERVRIDALERHPEASTLIDRVLRDLGRTAHESIPESVASGQADQEARVRAVRRFRPQLRRDLQELWDKNWRNELADGREVTPGVDAKKRRRVARDELVRDCEGAIERAAISLSLTAEERRETLRGVILTRAVDNQLKAFFLGGKVRFGSRSFQGKGFRSLGQEAIFAASLRLHRGESYHSKDGSWTGDVIAPLIRDLGAALGMRSDDEAIRQVFSAQMGKAGPPMEGRDLHVGDFAHGILPASAPLSISTLTSAGLAMAFDLDRAAGADPRITVSFIGDGGCSLGEWHEAINLCAARQLPAVFCIQNNQTALSTPLRDQTSVRTFADKAMGYGIPAVTVDGTDPDEVAVAFTWAADHARSGAGPVLVELVSMRMCGHAHHDDMLYLGKDPAPSWKYPRLSEPGYADPKAFSFWSRRDPLVTYAARLRREGLLAPGELEQWKEEATARVEAQAERVIEADWPDPSQVGEGVFADEPPRVHRDPLKDPDPQATHRMGFPDRRKEPAVLEVEPTLSFDAKGTTFLEAIMLGVRDALASDKRVFVYGQDVGGSYGNAFLLLRPLLEKFGDRILNSTLAEGGILGVCVGAALAGRRPIGEIQFNDFVATGFNQLVNNAAKIRYRWGGSVPMVVRLPWGGLRSAGPYHSQNTEPWFYRTPGLKIVVPSTPEDARALMAAAVADPDPVLFYEHIALYRDPKIKQKLPKKAPAPLPLGKAALRRKGEDLVLISYGAYVHRCLSAAEKLEKLRGASVAVLDLRSLVPLDRETLFAAVHATSRAMIVQEDSRTGGIGESLAAILQEELFESLDAPIRILGALDTPVPYSPPLEQAFLIQEEQIVEAAERLLDF